MKETHSKHTTIFLLHTEFKIQATGQNQDTYSSSLLVDWRLGTDVMAAFERPCLRQQHKHSYFHRFSTVSILVTNWL